MAGTWQRLAHVELSSTTATISTVTFTAKENLRFVFYGIGVEMSEAYCLREFLKFYLQELYIYRLSKNKSFKQ